MDHRYLHVFLTYEYYLLAQGSISLKLEEGKEGPSCLLSGEGMVAYNCGPLLPTLYV